MYGYSISAALMSQPLLILAMFPGNFCAGKGGGQLGLVRDWGGEILKSAVQSRNCRSKDVAVYLPIVSLTDI
jgi:hypothetical protein